VQFGSAKPDKVTKLMKNTKRWQQIWKIWVTGKKSCQKHAH